MITQFFLSLRHDMDIPGLSPVRYNIQNKIYSLKYCNYKRISLEMVHDRDYEPSRMGLWWDDGRIADIRWYMDEKDFRNGDGSLNFPAIYKTVLSALEPLWRKKKWNTDDLKEMYQMMESERFFVSTQYGQVSLSPDKSHKVELYCELYPDYADYYLCFYSKRNKWKKMIKYLRGHEEPEVFFWYFANRYWQDNENFIMADRDKEISFVFTIHRDDFSVEYRLQDQSMEESENKIRSFGAGLTRSERMRLLGLVPRFTNICAPIGGCISTYKPDSQAVNYLAGGKFLRDKLTMNSYNIKDLLDELTLFWQTNKCPILDRLSPGIDISGEELQHFSGVLPKEVIDMYRWRNGILPEMDTEFIGRLRILEGGIFMRVDHVQAVQHVMEGDELGWDAGKLPLFESGGGEHYLIECNDSRATYGSIFFQSIGAVEFDRIISMYDSLYTLFLGILECSKNGIYRYDSEGFLEVDYDRSHQVMKKLNPNSAYWKLF